MTGPIITTDLDLPRGPDANLPLAWIEDRQVSLDARGLLHAALSHAGPDVDLADLGWHPTDPPVAGLVAELVEAGYLIPAGDNRYRLIHPDRLGPLTQMGDPA